MFPLLIQLPRDLLANFFLTVVESFTDESHSEPFWTFLSPACSQEAVQMGEVKFVTVSPSENSLPSHHLSQPHLVFLTLFQSLPSSILQMAQQCQEMTNTP